MKITTRLSSFALTFGLAFISANSSAQSLDKTSVKFSGYIKADAMFSNYADGALATGNLGRDFYVPSLTPIGGESEGTHLDTHVRQSRFRFATDTQLENGEKITGVLEFDFHVSAGGDERISNSWRPRLRHGFMVYKNWLVGQTWTTFQDVKTLPETLDFIGVTDGTIFARQTMVRYTNGGFEFALENPETTVTPFGGGDRIITDDNALPDVIARYTIKDNWGHFSLAGMARQLAYENVAADIDSTATSYGVNLTSKIMLGKNDLRIMLNYGSGLGRYSGLNLINGAVLDENNDLEAIDSYGYSIAYRQVWNEKWRSSFTYSAFNADNEVELVGIGATKDTFSTRFNLLYSPAKAVTVGGEVTLAERSIESGDDGSMTRLQFSAMYKF